MSFIAVAAIGTGLAVGSGVAKGIIRGKRAKRDKKRAERDRLLAQGRLDSLIANRQEIINPFEDITNPYANLGVATKAAEMQIEQTDIALANTLDVIRATGAASGGATALAQAALQSKKDVAISIEKQEIDNQQLAAQGQQQMEIRQAQGRAFEFEAREQRELMELDRAQSMLDQARGRKVSAERAKRAANDSFLDLGMDVGMQAASYGIGRIPLKS